MKRYYRKVIKIRGQDSPNVRFAQAQVDAGKSPTGEVIIPGVLPYADYCKRRQMWDKITQCVCLDADFWEGSELLMFPPDWLNRANRLAVSLRGTTRRAKAIGVDPAEGGDKTSMVVVDELGVLDVVSKKTPNTAEITASCIALMRQWDVPAGAVMFDRGGGGKQHADRLREMGYDVRTVAFGAPSTKELKRGIKFFDDRVDTAEDRTAYVNMRAEMYYNLSATFDPSLNPTGFALPEEYTNLREELAPIPKLQDGEGRMKLMQKHKTNKDSKEMTLVELIGHSPDEADALAIAHHCMTSKPLRSKAGAI